MRSSSKREITARRAPSDRLLGVVVRVVLGLLVGTIFGSVGHLLLWFAWPVGWNVYQFIVAVVTGTGAAAGLGGMAGWFDLDAEVGGNLRILFVASVGGVGGAWAGYAFAQVMNDAGTFGDPSRVDSVLGAAIGANALFLFRNARFIRRGPQR